MPALKTTIAAAVAMTILTIASYCATPNAAPTAAPTSRTFAYDITVPLVYNGQNVGSTVIPKGNPVEVISETATTITIRHMGNTLTITKPGATPAPAVTTPATPKVTAQPTVPSKGGYSEIKSFSTDPEVISMAAIPQKVLPYPVMRIDIESDGSYTFADATITAKYSYKRVGTKLRILKGNQFTNWIWEVNDADTLESKVKTDPKLEEVIRKNAIECGYTYESFLARFATEEHNRVTIAPSPYTIPQNTPINKVLELIAARDPQTQSLVDAATKNSPYSIHWDAKNIPANIERVGMDTIAKEMLTTKLAPEEEISLRAEVEKVGVKHRRQIGDTCEIYSAYHLLDYYMKKGVIRPIGLEQLQAMAASIQGASTRLSPTTLLMVLGQTQPDLKIRVREVSGFGEGQTSYHEAGSRKIYQRFVQHELECGRPVWVGVGGHQVMMVGIKPIRARQSDIIHRELTALDSTGYGDKDHGYSTWSAMEMHRAISFEFVKK